MQKFITEFKSKAHNKALTSADMVALCYYKTIKAKSEDKAEILKYFLDNAFTPRKCGSREGLTQALHYFRRSIEQKKKYQNNEWIDLPRTFMDIPIEDVFTPEEIELLGSEIMKAKL